MVKEAVMQYYKTVERLGPELEDDRECSILDEHLSIHDKHFQQVSLSFTVFLLALMLLLHSLLDVITYR